MAYPRNATGDVFRRLEEHGFNFEVPHEVEFVAIFPTEEGADHVARQYVAKHKAGERFANIETRAGSNGGMELLIAKRFLVTYDAISSFEHEFEDLVRGAGGSFSGWEVGQDPS